AVALGLALHFSCWPLGRPIPFESVDIGVDTGSPGLTQGCESFQFGKHAIVVGTTPDEVTEIANCIPMYNSAIPQPLSQIDVSKQFVVVAVLSPE
ncbi:MAG: hypothetical protein GX620_03395, partial [Chloroflexi bacterium]|nr:hypothetical protein [Chloroflexota bacterium]